MSSKSSVSSLTSRVMVGFHVSEMHEIRAYGPKNYLGGEVSFQRTFKDRIHKIFY